MKIEKLNEQQIRCTLTREDLALRHIKLSELAYGTEKTRALFQDMMDQASVDFGFEAEDIPLMVEAIPMSAEQIVLIITKVESPDELDTRFSEFTHCLEADEDLPEDTGESFQTELELPEELLEFLGELRRELTESGESPAAEEESDKSVAGVCLFTFRDVDEAVPAARMIDGIFCGESSLYRDDSGDYLLFIHQGSHEAMEFNRICHTVGAYLGTRKCTPGMEAMLREHGRVLVSGRAVQSLAKL